MSDLKLTDAELNLAEIIWHQNTLTSSELIKLCEEEFGWKKSTTYTLLKRMIEKGVFENREGKIITLISKGNYEATQSKSFVKKTFGGSLPKFLAAFSKNEKLTEQEIEALQNLIDKYREV
ncbi:BlaI/MecI/CopY family transcriptional regulator [Fusibacter ferrireducens]|uniref:BlaI/MecI/CopY family transcriptional regulator n=1 Tax=Fusibacter ferrireducens TaxID=2785058 RepID=A0ABR9ZPK8_9FIRM|nr:BlaI/MecI/CopY family transcriptional regulator [Fusibacter ferrireducens]MBF4692408.1 BlaI/MecI/CopY family transcriptional regulator [Fusibacter ferrireducens]